MTLSITDRREAIKLAIKLADSTDIILLAGKGHENTKRLMESNTILMITKLQVNF